VKRVAIIQSAYIPWKGFFDLIGRCDVYVIYDSVAFSKGHWHNRNRIASCDGRNPWLTIPVKTAGRLHQYIEDVVVAKPWAEQHWSILRTAYASAPFFHTESAAVHDLFQALAAEPFLTKVNEGFLRWLCQRLGLATTIVRDRNFSFSGDRNARLIDLCKTLGADTYLSGPSARDYLDMESFQRAGIAVEWMVYGPYLPYTQPSGTFLHEVSVLDALFCLGPDAARFTRPIVQNAGSTSRKQSGEGVMNGPPCDFPSTPR
jgi:hypothetical protein